MRVFLFIFLSLFWIGSAAAQPNSLREPNSIGESVCVGKINASRSEFAFQIRPLQDGCKPEEDLLEIHRHPNGTYYFLPPGTSLLPESKPTPLRPPSDKPY